MSEAVLTDAFRERLAEQVAGGRTAPVPTHIAFGDGGHNPDLTPKPAPAARTALYAERDRVPLASLTRPAPTEAEAVAYLEGGPMVGRMLSEVGLIGDDGTLIAWRTFAPKVVEAGERYEVRIKPRF